MNLNSPIIMIQEEGLAKLEPCNNTSDVAEKLSNIENQSPQGGDCTDSVDAAEQRPEAFLNSTVAETVDKEKLDEQIRERIVSRAIVAVPVEEDIDDSLTTHKRYAQWILLFALCAGAIGMTVGLLIGKLTDDSEGGPAADTLPSLAPTSPPTTSTPVPTIQTILDRGYLSCGINENSLGFAGWNPNASRLEGFHVDLCRAIAAAVFGSTKDHLKFVDFPSSAYRAALDQVATNDSIDLLARGITYTMERDIYLKSVGTGVAFTVPYLYSGLAFAGFPPFLECADQYRAHGDPCNKLRICVCESCTNYDILRTSWFPSDRLVRTDEIFQDFAKGLCNVIANEKPYITKQRMTKEVPTLNTTRYEIGVNLFSKEPLAIVTSDQDPEWTSFCNLVLQGLLVAERYNITQDSKADHHHHLIVQTNKNDTYLETMFWDAIQAAGNYGEMYKRHLEDIIPRNGLDWINTKATGDNTGLVYSLRLGNPLTSPTLFNFTDSLETIITRGYLICGIARRKGFGNYGPKKNSQQQQWSGMDAEYCHALSNSIFVKQDSQVEFLEVADSTEGFISLSNKSIDVLTGANVTMKARDGVLDVNFLNDFSFSPIYFYTSASSDGGANIALATRQKDQQWSSFVFWVVYSTFYAEENKITEESYRDMPMINLFGPKLTTMFQETIRTVGNYGELYTKSLEKYYPRNGTRNELNEIPFNAQHFPPFEVDTEIGIY